ncbi:unnamed protein product [Prorocentrum cordatum]|uniref:ATP-dependent RNA helicase n=1 Tax=Prorocentrum cordatum TaxID=2364126 RepID=A0ABN9T140_9DINO|nr:unnamed protein product [Polarella glacialis]
MAAAGSSLEAVPPREAAGGPVKEELGLRDFMAKQAAMGKQKAGSTGSDGQPEPKRARTSGGGRGRGGRAGSAAKPPGAAAVAEPPGPPQKKAAAGTPPPVKASAVPPPMKSSPAKAALPRKAVAAAAAAVRGANMDPAGRLRKWAAFMRSRKESKGTARGEKVPENLSQVVDSDPQKWFETWVKQQCSWGKVAIEEKRKSSQTSDISSAGEWTWGWQIDQQMPTQVAEALKRSVRGNSQHRTCPGAENATEEDLSFLGQFGLRRLPPSLSIFSLPLERFCADVIAGAAAACREAQMPRCAASRCSQCPDVGGEKGGAGEAAAAAELLPPGGLAAGAGDAGEARPFHVLAVPLFSAVALEYDFQFMWCILCQVPAPSSSAAALLRPVREQPRARPDGSVPPRCSSRLGSRPLRRRPRAARLAVAWGGRGQGPAPGFGRAVQRPLRRFGLVPMASYGEVDVGLPPGFENLEEELVKFMAGGAPRGSPVARGLSGEEGATVVIGDGTDADEATKLLDMSLQFEDIIHNKSLLKGVYEMGFVKPSKIQAAALPVIARRGEGGLGQSMVGQAQNGSGKTATFALALLTALDIDRWEPQAMIICPTRRTGHTG